MFTAQIGQTETQMEFSAWPKYRELIYLIALEIFWRVFSSGQESMYLKHIFWWCPLNCALVHIIELPQSTQNAFLLDELTEHMLQCFEVDGTEASGSDPARAKPPWTPPQWRDARKVRLFRRLSHAQKALQKVFYTTVIRNQWSRHS